MLKFTDVTASHVYCPWDKLGACRSNPSLKPPPVIMANSDKSNNGNIHVGGMTI